MERKGQESPRNRGRSAFVALALTALLILEAFQAFALARTYELTASQAYRSCLGDAHQVRDGAPGPGECDSLRPLWQRADFRDGRFATLAVGLRSSLVEFSSRGIAAVRENTEHLRQRFGGVVDGR